MKTLLVVPWDEKRGGVISVVDNLARYLQAHGHEVLFFHLSPSIFLKNGPTKLGFDGVRLRLSLPFGRGLGGLVRLLALPVCLTGIVQLLWLLRSRRIQVVNVHYPIDNFVYFAICRRLLPIRLVTAVHGRDAFVNEKPKVHYSRAFKFLIRSSDLVITPSDAYRSKLLQAFPEMTERAIFIHNGIDPLQFRSGGAADNSGVRNRYMLCVAELRDYKAIDVLLHAAEPLLASDPGLTLVLAGDGPLRGDLEQLATSLRIRQKTMFLGFQGASEIARLLHGCELLVLPSRMEPFGIALIEAMAAKIPVVATNVGGIPEIVEHEVSGILVAPENAAALTEGIRRVLRDADLRRSLAENGYARVMERFCVTHNGAAYLQALTTLLSNPPAIPQTP